MLREKITAIVDELLALDDYVGIGVEEGDVVRNSHWRRRGDALENTRDVVWFYQALQASRNSATISTYNNGDLIEFDTLKKIAVSLSSESYVLDARSLIVNEMDVLPVNTSPREAVAASLIIQCYCISGNVSEAESLFFTWLFLKHSKGYPKALELNDDDDARVCMQFVGTLLTVRDATIYHGLAKDLFDKGKVILKENQTKVLEKALDGIDYNVLMSNDIPTEVWESMLKMYANLKSFQSCQLVCKFYNKRYSSLPTPEMYHHTILALCASRMYDQAMQVVADLRSVESGVSDDSNHDSNNRQLSYSSVSTMAYIMGVLSNATEVSDERFMTLYPSIVDAILVNNEAQQKLVENTNDGVDKSIVVEIEGNICETRNERIRNPIKLGVSFRESMKNGSSNMVAMLSNTLCLRGQLDKAARLLPELHKAGVAITADSVEPIINGYAVVGSAQKALELFEWMILDIKISPMPMTYHNVCESMRKGGSIDSLASFMTKYGVSGNNNRYDELK